LERDSAMHSANLRGKMALPLLLDSV
jgi:hypothetical protein